MTYAQSDEDDLIVRAFPPGHMGRFIDLGCYDGKACSNTYRLAELGWEGVGVDPSWRIVDAWHANMDQFADKVRLIRAAVAPTHGLIDCWDSKGPFTTCAKWVQDRGASERAEAQHSLVAAITPAELLAVFPRPDVVSIDVEGMSLDLMRVFPWLASGCCCAVIEAFRPEHAGIDEAPIVRAHMEALGFTHLRTTAENVVLWREP